jgi:hypothetical protein
MLPVLGHSSQWEFSTSEPLTQQSISSVQGNLTNLAAKYFVRGILRVVNIAALTMHIAQTSAWLFVDWKVWYIIAR